MQIKQWQKYPVKELMKSISAGPSHSGAISVKKQIYTWGYNESGRLGLSKSLSKDARRLPMLVSYIAELMQKNKEGMEGRRVRDGEEEEDNVDF